MASLRGGFEAAVAGCDEAVYVGCELMELIKIYKRCTFIRDNLSVIEFVVSLCQNVRI